MLSNLICARQALMIILSLAAAAAPAAPAPTLSGDTGTAAATAALSGMHRLAATTPDTFAQLSTPNTGTPALRDAPPSPTPNSDPEPALTSRPEGADSLWLALGGLAAMVFIARRHARAAAAPRRQSASA
jgi:hypothetical protein